MPPKVDMNPSVAELQAYVLGEVDPRRADEIESFLTRHPEYLAVLENTPDDDLVRHLRGAGEPDTSALEAQQTTVPPTGPCTPASKEDLPAGLAEHPRYRVIRKLGEGGMGMVFLAEHRLMNRPVALKLIRAACLDHPVAVDRFRREVQAAAQLSHPHIVSAHDAEEAGGHHFLVMEYVEGVPLSDWLAERGPLPAAEACGYLRQAALGLQYAHEQGMVHRDLKPHNMMRAPDGSVKILDFGLARFASQQEQPGAEPLTHEGMVVGTADYMAPEQAQDSRRADIRADVYSLGCSLYHLLAGRVPFPGGTTIEKIVKHSTEQPESLARLRPDLPRELVKIVERMMALGAADRYQTPVDVAEALGPFTDARPARRPPARRWWVAAGLLGLLSVMAAVVVIVKTARGEITVQTDDPDVELVVRKNGDLVRIMDRKAGRTWELDTKKLNLGLADDEDGLRIDLDGKKPLVLRRKGGSLITITGPGEAAKVDATAARRNPFGVEDVEDIDDPEVVAFAAGAKPRGQAGDENAKQWATRPTRGEKGTLDGEWFGRWKHTDEDWNYCKGTVRIKAVGQRVYILYTDHLGRFLVDSRRQGDRLIGRVQGLDDRTDSAPCVFTIVGPDRLDGDFGARMGRIDFRRKLE